MIKFTVPGVPVAKGRARSTKSGRHYTPAKTLNYEKAIWYHGTVAMQGGKRITGRCKLKLSLFMPIPSSWSKKKRQAAIGGLIYPTSKPDSSNILKAIEDGLNRVVYVDDSQITDHIIKKRYSLNPRAEICIEEIIPVIV